MITLEQVEKLRKYGDISYDEAKNALEESNGDILEAIIILERQGIIKEPTNGGYHNSRNEQQNTNDSSQEENFKSESKEDNETSFSELMGRVFKWVRKMIQKGNVNHFEVVKDGKKVITIPVTILVLISLFAFWIVIPLLIVGLFFGYRYTFLGPDLGRDNVNEAMGTVADAANKFKKEMKDEKANGEDINN